MEAVRQERSITQLLRELSNEISTLLRQEVALAKAEASAAVARLASRLAAMVVGGVVALAGALALVAALCVGVAVLLARWMPPAVADWLGPAVVGLVLTLIGYGRVRSALNRLKHDQLSPRKTTQTLQENKAWLKAKIT
jgi:xanthine/uracil permease